MTIRCPAAILSLGIAIVMCIGAQVALCQDAPKLGVFAGYSHMRGLPTSDTVPLNGWAAALFLKVKPRIGLVATAFGDYGTATMLSGSYTSPPNDGSVTVGLPTVRVYRTPLPVQKHSISLGPEIRALKWRGVAIHASAGIGIVRGNYDAPMILFVSPGEALKSPSSFGVAAFGGGNAQIRLTERLAVRVVQVDYVGTQVQQGWQRNVRLSTGFVVTAVQ